MTTNPRFELRQQFYANYDNALASFPSAKPLITLNVEELFVYRRLYFGRLWAGYQAYINHRLSLRMSLRGQLVAEVPFVFTSWGSDDSAGIAEDVAPKNSGFDFPQIIQCSATGEEIMEDMTSFHGGANWLRFHSRVSFATEDSSRTYIIHVPPFEICAQIDKIELLHGYWGSSVVNQETYGTVYMGLACYSQNLPF